MKNKHFQEKPRIKGIVEHLNKLTNVWMKKMKEKMSWNKKPTVLK